MDAGSQTPKSLAERSITSVAWNAFANLLKIAILVARSIWLARLLSVETFGIYALATSIVTFTGILPMFGMGSAFLHRAAETANEEQAAAVHFTLRLMLTLCWAGILILGSYLFASDELRLALVLLTLAFAGLYLTDTPKIILTRRVAHRRLAVLDLLTALVASIVAVFLASRGFGILALLATDIVTLVLAVVGLYLWQPVWRPRLLWLGDSARYYLSFGGRAMVGGLLSAALDHLDDIWVGTILGNQALGFYSRAYTFATYPRRLIAFPVNMVAGGTYAELKDDRLRLSQAFFRTNALLIRSGFLLGGLLVLIAPEFVGLALGEKWMPMVPAFRLMAVFTLLDPIRVTISQVFLAVGQPERIIRVRLLQLAVLIGGLFALGLTFGIEGVAIVMNLTLLAGLIPLLRATREHVDLSVRSLFAAPLAAISVGTAVAITANYVVCLYSTCPNDWVTGFTKAAAFSLVFGGVIWALEGPYVLDHIKRIKNILSSKPTPTAEKPTDSG